MDWLFFTDFFNFLGVLNYLVDLDHFFFKSYFPLITRKKEDMLSTTILNSGIYLVKILEEVTYVYM